MGGATFCLLCRLSPGCSPFPLFLSRPLSRSGRSSSIYPPGCHPSTGALTASNPSHPHLSGSGLPIKATLSSSCPLPALPSVPPLLSLPLVARYREQRRRVHTPGIHSSSLRRLGLSSIPLPFTLGPSHAQPLSFTLGPSNAHSFTPSFLNGSRALSLATTHSHRAPNTLPPSPGSTRCPPFHKRRTSPALLLTKIIKHYVIFFLMLVAWKTALRPEVTTRWKTALRPEDTGSAGPAGYGVGVL
jgi:hypothetical protein